MKKTLILLALGLSFILAQAGTAAQLVVNGGFETGDFAGWTVTPAASGSTVFVYGGPGPHWGNYAAWFGATGATPDTISQVLPTVAGRVYGFGFWLRHPIDPENEFTVTWGGTTVLHLVNSPAFRYRQYGPFKVVARGPNTVIAFSGREAGSWYLLDDIFVYGADLPVTPLAALRQGSEALFQGGPLQGPAVPLPGTLVLLGSGLLGLLGWRRMR
jgi:hypothetical protein